MEQWMVKGFTTIVTTSLVAPNDDLQTRIDQFHIYLRLITLQVTVLLYHSISSIEKYTMR